LLEDFAGEDECEEEVVRLLERSLAGLYEVMFRDSMMVQT
jgi:hypothetical protein